jgi:hypothetical protein
MTSSKPKRAVRAAVTVIVATVVLFVTGCSLLPGHSGSGPTSSNRAPIVTTTQVKSVEAPPMCGRPAGKLVNGSLPVADPLVNGSTILAVNAQKKTMVATGVSSAFPDGVVGIVFSCSAGGVEWPNVVGFYDHKLKPVASQDVAHLDNQEHSDVQALTFSRGKFHAVWLTNDSCHYGADDSVPRSADFGVDASGKVKVSNSVTGKSSQPCDG